MTKKLLTRAAEKLSRRGLQQQDSIQDIDKEGVAFLPFSGEDSDYLVRAKEYLYQDKAPFSPYQVERANSWDTMLVLYINEEDEFYVFDSRFVSQCSEVQYGESKRTENKKWLEVSLDDGVCLSEYRTEGKYPRRVGEKNMSSSDSQQTVLDF